MAKLLTRMSVAVLTALSAATISAADAPLSVRQSHSETDGSDVVYFQVQGERPEAEVKKVRSEIPPVVYQAPQNRWDALPVSRARLAEKGGIWRVVMLGDSIVNDSWRSRFGEDIQANLPQTRLELTAVVAGAKGCWWYRLSGRVRRFITPLQPDLLIIGGISHNNDLDAVRAVMHAVRDARECDVLLLSGPFGNADPTNAAAWAKVRENTPDAWHMRLAALARDEKAGFLDLQQLWGDYTRNCGRPLDWFKRDPVHANARGEAVLGHFLSVYLTPQ
jgi:hypothetical protein